MIISNIVTQEKMREVQKETLGVIANSLINSFGPLGSNTIIAKGLEGPIVYTKDGHTILKNIKFNSIIEQSVKTDLESLTANIVKTVGDGTTSGIVLADLIFKELDKEVNKDDTEYTPYQLIEAFKTAVDEVVKEIRKSAKPFTPDEAYNITYTATNGNVEVATNIKNIYEKYGNGVFIDVAASTGTETMLKIYDGMTIDTGYSDTAYINTSKGACDLRNASIYYFEDPIDTVEMSSLLKTIVEKNIMNAYTKEATTKPVPTVVLAPMVSRDMIPYVTSLINFMMQFGEDNKVAKPPFLLITNMHQEEQLDDIARMCGCKPIKKYIDLKLQESDIEKGLAPTLETVCDFAGHADEVIADVNKTKFINPLYLNDEEDPTKRSELFNSTVKFLEDELDKVKTNGGDVSQIGKLKRRINSLKSNMVEYLVGGVSIGDRDALKHLVEDAVLNCRSASIYGVGLGSNLEAAHAAYNLKNDSNNLIYSIIADAYYELITKLYMTAEVESTARGNAGYAIENHIAYDIKTRENSTTVVTSIETDVVILETISKIITLMFTANQFLCPEIHYNHYNVAK